MVKKIVFGNFKGGVGKTTNSVMFSYELAKQGIKVLLCDLDPQANSTQLLNRTYTKQHKSTLDFQKTMMVAVQDGDLRPAIVEMMENLFLLPSHVDFINYPDFLELKFPLGTENYKEARIAYFQQLLKEVEDDYDLIIIDCPPTISKFTDSAIYSSDYIIIVLQTQQRSLDGAGAFWEYAQTFYDNYPSTDFDIAGILPVLMKNDSAIDNQIISDAIELFGTDNVFDHIVKHSDRLKRYDREGISDKDFTDKWDYHDTKLHTLYTEIADELLSKIGGLS
ncbi:AAA family ATPase [Enterococcus sp. AZ103]|uniref:AAA family ATPase n=1 Tax=Enterococcus sp. AZ103 TaxID=2774628 RepID=UPI003F1FEB08